MQCAKVDFRSNGTKNSLSLKLILKYIANYHYMAIFFSVKAKKNQFFELIIRKYNPKTKFEGTQIPTKIPYSCFTKNHR